MWEDIKYWWDEVKDRVGLILAIGLFWLLIKGCDLILRI